MTHLKISQAGIVSLFTAIVGQVIALVPQWAPEKADILQGGSMVIAAVFLLANAVHHIADSRSMNLADVEARALAAVKSEVGKIDFNALVKQAEQTHSVAELEQLAEQKVQQALQRLLTPAAPVPPVTPTPTVPPAS